jgi:hypothetical protein
MDQFADGMIARDPTLAADRATWTGSLHIVDLPSVEAARRFVEREPYNRAGCSSSISSGSSTTCSAERCGSPREGPTTLASSSSRTR